MTMSFAKMLEHCRLQSRVGPGLRTGRVPSMGWNVPGGSGMPRPTLGWREEAWR
jgi:hypothetical protein